MFNFQNIAPQIRSRQSVSDPGLYNRIHASSGNEAPPQKSSSGYKLPRIVHKSRSTLMAAPVRPGKINAQTEPPGRKLLPYKEMLYLTLKHVKNPNGRGHTFDQLYTFITGAFEIPRSYTLESKLRKTLSNMESRGVVEHCPGLEPRYKTYKISEIHETSNQRFCVNGKSVPAVPTWPNGFNLPAGGNLVSRPGPRDRPQIQMKATYRNIRTAQCRSQLQPDSLDFLPNPMICQSFGARAGLKGNINEHRPNSRNSGDEEFCIQNLAVMNLADEHSGNYVSRELIGDYGEHINNSAALCSNFPPKRMSSPPRILDTISSDWSLDVNEEDLGNRGKNKRKETKNRLTASRSTARVSAQVQCDSNDDDYDESPAEEEQNNRSCIVMNGLSRNSRRNQDDNACSRAVSTVGSVGDNEDKNQMDYLLGIANIIDCYDSEPPVLQRSGRSLLSNKKLTLP